MAFCALSEAKGMDIKMKCYELRVNTKLYDIMEAVADSQELIWNNSDGKLEKGDVVYIIIRGKLMGKAICGMQVVIRDVTELPGGKKYWDFKSEILENHIENRNFIKLVNYQSVLPSFRQNKMVLSVVKLNRRGICEISPQKYCDIKFVRVL